MIRMRWLLLPLSFLHCSSGADASSSAPDAAPGDCASRVMVQHCATAGCHVASAGGPAQANLDLTPGVVGDGRSLVNAPAQGSFCASKSTPPPVIIDPHSPEKSLLYNKLLSAPVCGPQMPFLRAALAPADQQCVLDWIKTVPGVGG